jgi:starch synthase
MVTPEAHPFAKTGGLAEVSGALSHALTRLGHRVTIVLPRYHGIALTDDDTELKTTLTFGDRLQPVSIYERTLSEHLAVAFVDVPELFDRNGLYGTTSGDYPDNAWRFAVLGRAALEYPRLRRQRPSVIHGHDWQSVSFRSIRNSTCRTIPVGGVPSIFTIHNLAFQGHIPGVRARGRGLAKR